MNAVMRVRDIAPETLGGAGGGGVPPFLASIGLADIEVHTPSGADKLRFYRDAVSFHHFRDGLDPIPVRRSLSKTVVEFLAADPDVIGVEAPSRYATFTHWTFPKRFVPDMQVNAKPGAQILELFEIESPKFFIYVQPCRFADQENLEPGFAALRMATGLPVVLFNEGVLASCRREVFHG